MTSKIDQIYTAPDCITQPWDYYAGPLVPAMNHLVKKIHKGYFNILLVFGATRAGKSTAAMQIADYLAKNVGVEFSEKNIYFDAVALEKDCKGKKRQVFLLDEAAFDLTGEDWAKDAQKRLKTYFSVAAKYNQTFILIIPHIEELRKFFVINEHTRGIEVLFNRKSLDRGYMKLYTRESLRRIYYLRKMNHYGLASAEFGFYHRFPYKIPQSINIDDYEKRKDAAIKAQEEADSSSNTKLADFIYNMLLEGIPSSVITRVLKCSRGYVTDVKQARYTDLVAMGVAKPKAIEDSKKTAENDTPLRGVVN